MKILVIGSGGREHALCWKIAQSPLCSKLYAAPGNDGIKEIAEVLPIASSDISSLLDAAQSLAIDLTVVGPDEVLAAGLVDIFMAHGLKVFGPTKNAAKLEWSKVYSKQFMQRHGIATAASVTCSTPDEAINALNSFMYPVVIKADGLALGKGVIIANDQKKAIAAIHDLFALGSIASELVIEEYLEGRELSLITLCDGTSIVPLLPAEDHKQLLNDDKGPNTGGMGAIAPLPWLGISDYNRICEEIVIPTWQALLTEGIDYRGVLYFGLMMTETGPKVLEYNCRFGDPETQVLLPLIKSCIVQVMLACIAGELNADMIEYHQGFTAGVVLCSKGYPQTPEKGLPICGLDSLEEGVIPFYAGVRLHKKKLLTNGGRVLCLMAKGDTVTEALNTIYRNIHKVQFDGMHYRTDIGNRSKKSATLN